MSEIVVGSWVKDGGRTGRVTSIRRNTGRPVEADEVCYLDTLGAVYVTSRGALKVVDAPAPADALTQEIAQLKDEVAALEAEMERRDRVAREKYAALERDRDNVERIMREASQRADQYERDLKVVLERESRLRATLEKTRAEFEATHTLLRQMTDARDTACAESAARLRKIMAAEERADMWQSAAADALAQIKALREAAK